MPFSADTVRGHDRPIMSTHAAGRLRMHFGPGALGALASELRRAPGRQVLLTSERRRQSEIGPIQENALRCLDVVTVPDRLDASAAEMLRDQVAGAGVIVGVGGGRIMDATKAVARPGAAHLVLIPTTLSGSEHSPNTSWWDGDRKTVLRVGAADAVIFDTDLLVREDRVLEAGAFHAIAHALAVLTNDRSATHLMTMAATGAADLFAGCRGRTMDDYARFRLARGSWFASVALMATGPTVSMHHRLVYAVAKPGHHAQVSAVLLGAAIAYTEVFSGALECLRHFGVTRDEISRIARHPLDYLTNLCEWAVLDAELPDDILPYAQPVLNVLAQRMKEVITT